MTSEDRSSYCPFRSKRHTPATGDEMTQANKIAAELLQMNRDALAALVILGAKTGNVLQFVTDPTDRFIVSRMIVTVR